MISIFIESGTCVVTDVSFLFYELFADKSELSFLFSGLFSSSA